MLPLWFPCVARKFKVGKRFQLSVINRAMAFPSFYGIIATDFNVSGYKDWTARQTDPKDNTITKHYNYCTLALSVQVVWNLTSIKKSQPFFATCLTRWVSWQQRPNSQTDRHRPILYAYLYGRGHRWQMQSWMVYWLFSHTWRRHGLTFDEFTFNRNLCADVLII